MEGGTYPHFYPHVSPPLGLPVLDQEWSNSWPVDIPAYTQYPQDCGEATSPYEQMQDMQGAYRSLSVDRSLNSMYQTTSPWSPQLALPGSEGYFHYASEEGTALGDVDATLNSRMDRVSMQDQGLDHTTRDFSMTFPIISCTPTAMQYEERSQYQRSQELEKRPTAASSYSCDICGKVYAQSQGVRRHHREAHQVKMCTYCGEFKWGRPYQLRRHLQKQHPNVDPDAELGRLTRSHRKATNVPNHSPQQRVSPPTPEHNRRSRAEPHLFARAPPASAIAPVSPPVISSLDYHPQPEHAETMNTTNTHEYFDKLKLPDASAYACANTAILSTVEHAKWANDLEIASQNGQIWYQNNGQLATQGASTAAGSQDNLCHPYHLTAQPSSNSWLTV